MRRPQRAPAPIETTTTGGHADDGTGGVRAPGELESGQRSGWLSRASAPAATDVRTALSHGVAQPPKASSRSTRPAVNPQTNSPPASKPGPM